MSSPAEAVAVWVCREEKLVCGVTKRTGCAQLVKALLEDHAANAGVNRRLPPGSSPEDYCIAERWRGFERSLPPQTKILRLWTSWGEERANVSFALVKSDASSPLPGLRAAEAKVVTDAGAKRELSPAQCLHKLPVDRQKRMVRKAFKKLAKMNKVRQDSSLREREGMETLIHLILSQDLTIRQQVQRMRDLDADIERYESNTHFERIRSEGENYVQETYLLESPEGGGRQARERPGKADRTLQLEEHLQHHRELIEKLSADIEREAGDSRLKSQGDAERKGCQDLQSLRAEIGRVKGQLGASLRSALQIHSDFIDFQEQVKRSETSLGKKADECDYYAEQLKSVHPPESAESGLIGVCKDFSLSRKSVKHQPGNLSLICATDLNDTDSDTGISSTHSQDLETPCVQVLSA